MQEKMLHENRKHGNKLFAYCESVVYNYPEEKLRGDDIAEKYRWPYALYAREKRD